MLGYTGTYKGKKISVMGSGMGVPSATLYAHELYTFFDVEAIIRVGSAGAFLDEMHPKDMVIAMTASTNSNFAHQYQWPGTLAPTADFGMLSDAVSICKERGTKVHIGNVFSTRILRGVLKDGKVSFAKGQKNGQTITGIQTNCLLRLEKGEKPLQSGDTVEVMLI
ncbi:MAG: hypothetical protein HUJ54_15505 [Erysipelotrichaceae bacterium]|nr:hypothetical protein [Erysipelotrichaceae bacterium]